MQSPTPRTTPTHCCIIEAQSVTKIVLSTTTLFLWILPKSCGGYRYRDGVRNLSIPDDDRDRDRDGDETFVDTSGPKLFGILEVTHITKDPEAYDWITLSDERDYTIDRLHKVFTVPHSRPIGLQIRQEFLDED